MDTFLKLALVFLTFVVASYTGTTRAQTDGHVCFGALTQSNHYGFTREEARGGYCTALSAAGFESVSNFGTDGCAYRSANRNKVTYCAFTSTPVCTDASGLATQTEPDGSCPADDNGSDGDDDDGDGSDCDEGEEEELDCNDGDDDDYDRDDDGESDSEDGDDGFCFDEDGPEGSTWKGEGDRDPDCPPLEEECPTDETQFYNLPFPPGQDYLRPPQNICDGSCEFTLDIGIGRGCRTRVLGGVDWGLHCEYGATGETCDVCTTPECDGTGDDECPEGQQRIGEASQCTEIENFCDIDEHTNGTEDNQPDGLADNADSFACGNCNPNVDADCVKKSSYNCDVDPPECVDDPVVCAVKEQTYELQCGTDIGDPFECEESFTCTGSLLECAKIEFDRENYCQYQLTEEEEADPDNLANFREGVDDGAEYEGGDEVDGSFIDVESALALLDDSGLGFPRTCFEDYDVSFFGNNYTVEVSRLCPILGVLGVLIMIVASIISGRIVLGAF